jgi:hypothetical protein
MSHVNKRDSWKIPFVSGLIFGISSAISLKMNVSLDQEYYLRLILSTVCEVTNNNFPKGTSWTKPDCGSYLMWFDILTVIIFIITILAAISATGKVVEGIILYLLGALIGFALIFLFVH